MFQVFHLREGADVGADEEVVARLLDALDGSHRVSFGKEGGEVGGYDGVPGADLRAQFDHIHADGSGEVGLQDALHAGALVHHGNLEEGVVEWEDQAVGVGHADHLAHNARARYHRAFHPDAAAQAFVDHQVALVKLPRIAYHLGNLKRLAGHLEIDGGAALVFLEFIGQFQIAQGVVGKFDAQAGHLGFEG